MSRHRADTWKRPAWDVAEDMESPASILDCPPHHGLRAAAASKNSEVIDTIEAHNVWCPSAFNPHELGHQLGVRSYRRQPQQRAGDVIDRGHAIVPLEAPPSSGPLTARLLPHVKAS